MLRGGHDDDEEEDSRSKNPVARLIKRSALYDVVADFAKAAVILSKPVGTATIAITGTGQDEGYEQVKTIKEVLEEREEQMKDLE